MRYAIGVRYLGLDVGTRRIGMALSDPTGTLARPWRMLERRASLRDVIAALAREIRRLQQEEDGLAGVVIGRPSSLNGRPHVHTRRVLVFAEALGRAIAVPIALQDERLTSREAESRLALRERDWRRRKMRLDAAAAAVILQDYLDWQADGRGRAPEAAGREPDESEVPD